MIKSQPFESGGVTQHSRVIARTDMCARASLRGVAGDVSTVTASLSAASTTYTMYVSLAEIDLISVPGYSSVLKHHKESMNVSLAETDLVSFPGDSSVLKHHKESLRAMNCLESTWTQSRVPARYPKQFSEICTSQKGSIDRVIERLQRSKVSRGHTERHGMSHRHYKTQKERLQGSKGLQRSKGPYYVTNKRYVPRYHAYEYDRLLQVMEKAVMAFLRA